MHFKLISPSESARVFAVPENAGFDRDLPDELEHRGHTYEFVDSDDLSPSLMISSIRPDSSP